MDRRGLFHGAILSAAASLSSAARAATVGSATLKVVYHLSDYEKADFVLHNIRIHFEAIGGADKIMIALVVHGPAVRAFARNGSAATLERFSVLVRRGLSPYLCAVAMRGQNLEENDMAPGFEITETGVVRLAELQRHGYIYLRP